MRMASLVLILMLSAQKLPTGMLKLDGRWVSLRKMGGGSSLSFLVDASFSRVFREYGPTGVGRYPGVFW